MFLMYLKIGAKNVEEENWILQKIFATKIRIVFDASIQNRELESFRQLPIPGSN